jgi:hypothetical protein
MEVDTGASVTIMPEPTLDQESRKYVVISTHKRLFHYTRLPYGVSAFSRGWWRTYYLVYRELLFTLMTSSSRKGWHSTLILKSLEEVLKWLAGVLRDVSVSSWQHFIIHIGSTSLARQDSYYWKGRNWSLIWASWAISSKSRYAFGTFVPIVKSEGYVEGYSIQEASHIIEIANVLQLQIASYFGVWYLRMQYYGSITNWLCIP